MVDKNYCMSSYMAFRYIADEGKDFYDGIYHKNIVPIPDKEKKIVKTAEDIDSYIKESLKTIKNRKKGLLLSGGMDSAILASYMQGCEAYTFRFLDGKFHKEELERAEYYANYYNLNLHYVDINWNTVEENVDILMRSKAAPIHSIEPQIMQAAMQAKSDGIEVVIIGNGSDYVFGGMDQLLSRDWQFDEFVKRYIYIDPKEVLNAAVDVSDIFEKYRDGNDIDFLGFMEDVATIESYSSYENAFKVADMPYLDPYANMKMNEPLDLYRIRHGESKYLIRELFAIKYPNVPIPEKLPMPRPVDTYFEVWKGPTRAEFKQDLNMSRFSGNQKWQLYCLERFLNLFDNNMRNR